MADGSRAVEPRRLQDLELNIRIRFREEVFSIDLKSPATDTLTDQKLAEYFGIIATAIGFHPGEVAHRMVERYGEY